MRARPLAPVLLVALAALAAADEGQRPPVPEVGAPAPAFRLNDQTGKAVSIGPGASKTWVVLAFFPKAMTPG